MELWCTQWCKVVLAFKLVLKVKSNCGCCGFLLVPPEKMDALEVIEYRDYLDANDLLSSLDCDSSGEDSDKSFEESSDEGDSSDNGSKTNEGSCSDAGNHSSLPTHNRTSSNSEYAKELGQHEMVGMDNLDLGSGRERV